MLGLVLVQRDAELAAIERHLAASAGGDGGVLLLEGPAGIGKTALLQVALDHARRLDLAVLAARGGELERAAAWGVARELLQPALARLDPEHSGRLFHGPAAPAAAVFGAGAGDDLEGPDQAFRVAHALTWLVLDLAERQPLALAVDDAHWADIPSLRWLAFLARRLHGVPALVLIAARPAETSSDRALQDLATAGGIVRPSALGRAGVTSVVAAYYGAQPEADFASACYDATGGNPFLLNELLRQASAEGLAPVRAAADSVRNLQPEAVRRAVVLRLERLMRGALDLARAVAVLGDGVAPSTAGALAELDDQTVLAAVDALTRTEILADAPDLRFSHPLVRSAVYEDIAPARRAIWHRQAAELLARRGVRVEAVAAQLTVAERVGDRWAVERLLEASRAARQRGAPEAARDLAARALAEPPPADLRATTLEELGAAELGTGDAAGGMAHLDEALGVAETDAQRGSLALRLGQTLHVLGEFPEATRVLAMQLDRLPADAEPDLHRALESELIATALEVPATLDLMQERLDSLLARHRGPVLELDAPVLSLLGLVAVGQGRVAEGLVFAREALARRAAVAQGLPATVAFAATALRLADRLEEALVIWNAEIEDARARSAPLRLAWASDNRAMVLLRLARVAEAEADARTAVELQEALFPHPMPAPLGTHAETLLETAATGEAHQLIDRAALDDVDRDAAISGEPLRVRARLRAEKGDLAGALGDLERVARLAERYAAANPAAMPWRAQTALVRRCPGRCPSGARARRRGDRDGASM